MATQSQLPTLKLGRAKTRAQTTRLTRAKSAEYDSTQLKSEVMIDSKQPIRSPSPERAKDSVAPKTTNISQDAAAIVAALSQLLQTQTKTPTTSPYPKYTGRTEEDPHRFIEVLEARLNADAIPTTDRSRIFFTTLESTAVNNMAKYEFAGLTWMDLKERFLYEFDSPDIKAELKALLYSSRQPQKEDAASYIWRQNRLFDRVSPDEEEGSRVRIIRDQLNLDIRREFAVYTPSTIRELADAATRIVNLNALSNQRPKPPRQTQGNIPKCKFCPEYHWHRDCPIAASQIPEN